MNSEDYKKIVKKNTPKEPKIENSIIAFLTGGLIGLSGEILLHVLNNCFAISKEDSILYVCLIVIALSSLFTGLGFFDNWLSKTKCGLLIPTTGFAHSVTSCAIDYKKDGLITGLGANFFKLAGTVILYGMISAFFLAVLQVVIYG